MVEQRRRLLDEWDAWREVIQEYLEETGTKLPENGADEEEGEVIEEIVEEIIDETEEVVT